MQRNPKPISRTIGLGLPILIVGMCSLRFSESSEHNPAPPQPGYQAFTGETLRRPFRPDGPASNKFGLYDLDGLEMQDFAHVKWGVRMSGPIQPRDFSNSTGGSEIVTFGFQGLTPWSTADSAPLDLYLTIGGDAPTNRRPIPPFGRFGSINLSPVDAERVESGVLTLQSETALREVGLWNEEVSLFRELNFEWDCFSDGRTLPNGRPLKVGLDPEASKLIVLIHGWNRESKPQHYTDSYAWLISKIRQAIQDSPEWQLRLYHWEADADTGGSDLGTNAKEAAEIGHQHGMHLGEMLERQLPSIEKLHLVAHSAGSWCARSAARHIKNWRPDVTVQVTLLDAFIPEDLSNLDDRSSLDRSRMWELRDGSNGVAGIDLADHYLSRFDPAFGTGSNLFSNARDFFDFQVDRNDVGPNSYHGHGGPIQFYADTVEATLDIPPTNLGEVYGYEPGQHGWVSSLFAQEALNPISPDPVFASQSCPETVTISWTDRSVNETGFRIERRAGSGEWVERGTVGKNITFFTDDSLLPDTEYFYRVTALKDDYVAPPSDVVAVLIGSASPTVPLSGGVEVTVEPEAEGSHWAYVSLGGGLEIDIPIRVPISIKEEKIGEQDLLWHDFWNWDNPVLSLEKVASVVAVARDGAQIGNLASTLGSLNSLFVDTGPTERGIPQNLDLLTIHGRDTNDGIIIPDWELGISATGTLKYDVTIPGSTGIDLNQTAVLESLTLHPGAQLNGRHDMVVKRRLCNFGSIVEGGGEVVDMLSNAGSITTTSPFRLHGILENSGEIRARSIFTVEQPVANRGTFVLEGGSLSGTGSLSNEGTFRWTDGSISGDVLTNRSDEFVLTGASRKRILGAGRFVNHGAVHHDGSGTVELSHNSRIYNLGGALYQMAGEGFFGAPSDSSQEAAGFFLNEGIVRKTGIGNFLFRNNGNDRAEFRNRGGILEILEGSLHLNSGGWIESGNVSIASNSTLLVDAPFGSIFGFRGVTELNGDGALMIENAEAQGAAAIRGGNGGTTVRVTGLLRAETDQSLALNLSDTDGGKVISTRDSFVGGDGVIANYGRYDWQGGAFTGSAFRNYGDGMRIVGGEAKHVYPGSVTNFGELLHEDGAIVSGFRNEAVFRNAPGAIYRIEGNGTLGIRSESGATLEGAFQNEGRIIKDGPGNFFIEKGGDDRLLFQNLGGQVEISGGSFTAKGGGFSRDGTYVLAAGSRMVTSAQYSSDPPFLFEGFNTLEGEGVFSVSGPAIASGEASLSGNCDLHVNRANSSVYGALRCEEGNSLVIDISGNNTAFRHILGTVGGSGTIENRGSWRWTGGVVSGTALRNLSSDFEISGGEKNRIWSNALLTNAGEIRHVDGSGDMILHNGAILRNGPGGVYRFLGTGTLREDDDSSFESIGTFENQGLLRKEGNGSFMLRQTGNDTIMLRNDGGTIELAEGSLNLNCEFEQQAGTIRLEGGGLVFSNGWGEVAGGVVEGAGRIVGSVRYGGVLKPKNGVVSVTGSLDQQSDGIFQGVLAGSSANSAPLDVGGTATLGGKLLVSRPPLTWPAVGDRYTILEAGTLNGEFTEVLPGRSMAGYSYEIEYNSSSVDVVVTATPQETGESWQEGTFTESEREDPQLSGFLADPDNDNRSNLREYLEVTNARSEDNGPAPVIRKIRSEGKTWFEIEYVQRRGVLDAEFAVLYSEDMKSWNDSETRILRNTPPVPNLDGLTETITVQVSIPAEDGESSAFFKLKERFVED